MWLWYSKGQFNFWLLPCSITPGFAKIKQLALGNSGIGAKVTFSGILFVEISSWDWSSRSCQDTTNGVICFDVKENAMFILVFLLPSTISVMVIGSCIYFKERIRFSLGSVLVSFHILALPGRSIYSVELILIINGSWRILQSPSLTRFLVLKLTFSLYSPLVYLLICGFITPVTHAYCQKPMLTFIIIVLDLSHSPLQMAYSGSFLLGLALNFKEICSFMCKLYYIPNLFHKFFFLTWPHPAMARRLHVLEGRSVFYDEVVPGFHALLLRVRDLCSVFVWCYPHSKPHKLTFLYSPFLIVLNEDNKAS